MNHAVQLAPGFADPVHDAQRAFRQVLEALSRPGRRFEIGAPVKGLALGAAMSHLLLTLTDDDTPVWWQPGDGGAAQWLRFHTGASLADGAGDAAFAVVLEAGNLPPLDQFASGSADFPERSATLFVEVTSLDEGPAVEWRGPGIRDMETVRIAGLPEGFWSQWQDSHGDFPQGVDVVFTCGDQAIGLPRTTRVRRLEGI